MRPPLNTIYLSDRLRQKLASIRDYPLTTIVAPAGYGKTTAINAFLRSLGADAMILKQSVLNDSASEFWREFARQVASLFPRDADEKFAALENFGLPTNGTVQREFLRILESDLPDEEIFFIIDDVHLLNNEACREFFLFLSRHLPERFHLSLLSRTPIFPAQKRLYLAGRCHEIGVDDLRFAASDAREYFAACGYALTEAAAAELMELSDGWAACLYINLLHLAETGHFAEKDSIQQMMEDVLLKPLPNSEREILAAASLLSAFSREAVAFVTDRADAPEIVEAIATRNAFLRHYAGGYKFHHLFEACLRADFAKFPAEKQAAYRRRAAKWCLKQNDAVAAARLFYAAGDFTALMTAIENGMDKAFNAEHKADLLRWFSDCPAAILALHPTAMVIYARKLFTLNMRRECREALDFVLARLDDNSTLPAAERDNILGEVAIIESFLYYNDIAAMSVRHRRACALMNRPTAAIEPTSIWGHASPSVFASYHRAVGTLDAENAVMIESMPFWYKLSDNQGRGAEDIFSGEMHFQRGEMTDSAISAERAIHTGTAYKQDIIIIAALFLQLRIAVAAGDFSAVEATLKKMRELAVHNQEYVLLHTADLCEAWLYAVVGQIAPQAEWITAGRLDETRLLFPCRPLIHIVYNQVLLVQREYAKLLAHEADDRKLCRIYPTVYPEICLDIQLAAACGKLGKPSAAKDHLAAAIKAALPDKIIMPFAECGADSEKLLREMAAERGELAPIVKVCRQFRLAREKICRAHFPASLAPPPLNEREAAIAKMAADGSSNKEIAASLYLSVSRVKATLGAAYQKLGIADAPDKRKLLKSFL